jgi:hypothetical protein
MYDLPPDLPCFHTLRTWVARQLNHIDQAIAAAEKAASPAPQPTVEKPVEPPRKRTPEWGLARKGVGSSDLEVHRGDCWADGGHVEPISRERAVAELGAGVPACDVCRPEQVLLRPA